MIRRRSDFLPRGPIRDTCIVCEKPVYENDRALDFLGMWIHIDCYDAEMGVGRARPRAA